jgi:hypothetical protein
MYSPDGRWWWDGAQWIPAPSWRTVYVDTPWTRKLQVAILALQAVALLFGLATIPAITSSIFNSNAGLAGDPQVADFYRQFLNATLVFAAVFSLVVLAVLVIGVLKLWRWIYWYLMVGYGFAALSLPVNLFNAYGPGTIKLPGWYFFGAIPLLLAEVAMFVWMVLALRRYGTWARRKVIESA